MNLCKALPCKNNLRGEPPDQLWCSFRPTPLLSIGAANSAVCSAILALPKLVLCRNNSLRSHKFWPVSVLNAIKSTQLHAYFYSYNSHWLVLSPRLHTFVAHWFTMMSAVKVSTLAWLWLAVSSGFKSSFILLDSEVHGRVLHVCNPQTNIQ